MHHMEIPITLDVLLKSLQSITPRHLTDFRALCRPIGKAIEVLHEAFGFLSR